MNTSNTHKKLEAILQAVDDKKGINITAFEVTEQSGYTDYMVFVSGTSTQHNKTLWDHLVRTLKNSGFSKPMTEGEKEAAWILVDSGDVIVNIMLEEVRQYYDLESVWNASPTVSVETVIQK